MFIDVNRLSVPLLLYAVTSLQACANKKLIFGHRHAVESKKLREARLHAQLINRELVEIRNNDLTMRCTKPIEKSRIRVHLDASYICGETDPIVMAKCNWNSHRYSKDKHVRSRSHGLSFICESGVGSIGELKLSSR